MKFKAKITFAHGPNFYYPHVNELYTADETLVKNWAAAGYVEVIQEPKSKAEPKPKAEIEKPKAKRGGK